MPSESTTAAPPSDRDLQRTALTQLIALAETCATDEAALDAGARTSREQADRARADRGFGIEDRHARSTADTATKHQTRLAEINNQYQSERAALAANQQTLRQKLESDKRGSDERLRKNLDHAIWLAESVLELATNQTVVELKNAAERAEGNANVLNAVEVKAAELVQRYGLPLPIDPPPAPPLDPSIATDADAALKSHRQAAEAHLASLSNLTVANLFVGVRPYLISILVLAAAAAGVQAMKQTTVPQWEPLGIAVGVALAACIIIGLILRSKANRIIRRIYLPLLGELSLARTASEQQHANAEQAQRIALETARHQRAVEVQAAREQIAPFGAKAARDRDAGLTAAAAEYDKQLARLEQRRDAALSEAAQWLRRVQHEIDHARQRDTRDAKTQSDAAAAGLEQRTASAWSALQTRWTGGLKQIQAPIESDGSQIPGVLAWEDPAWQTWKPPRTFASRVRFGELQADLHQLTQNLPRRLSLPPSFSLPALLAFPAQASLLIDTDHAGRPDAIRTLQMLMARLLTSLPAGRVRFTIFDPVGLGQNFAGFMHLADYDDALVGGRIWTSQDQIDHRLADLTDHMETVIQKYLRNEFETIDQYNAQAGELAEPYRFLVIADLPVNFTADSFRRLTSIAASGARCGVYTLIARDVRAPLPAGAHLDELKARSVYLVRRDDRFVWEDPVFKQLPLSLGSPAPEEILTQLLHKVGVAAKESKRVEVAFEMIAPPPEQLWSRSSTSELGIPIGRLGANRTQSMTLGRGVAQHVLIAGKTGSGKSSLLHAMIVNAALWYSPDAVELYLIDFKKGVEFKTYAAHLLPHARAIAVESDREFGLSVLQRLDVELASRGELFRKAAVQDLAGYRKTAGAAVVPRTLLIIDEFQEFFTEDDKLAQEAALLIDRLVRQGRAFGVHVLLGSQTIGGAGGLPRSTLGQMAVRIALQTSEADSQLILGDNNSAARLLTRPGEAIYNDAGGAVEGNSPFQVAWLPDEKRDRYLTELSARSAPYFERFGRPVVFEGSSFADLANNAALATAAASGATGATLAWMGEPVAIKSPTAITLRRQAGTNVLMVGQQEEQALAVMGAMLLGVSAQRGPDQARFVLFDGAPADSPLAGQLASLGGALPHEVQAVAWRSVETVVDELATEVARRQETGEAGPGIYVFIYALQRFRQLRKSEDDFSFSVSDEPKKPNPGKQFAEILREGPGVGVHVITWVDTMVTIDRTLDRAALREFDYRVLFQMSAADSSNLIDSPAANKLGPFRALLYSDEQGVSERFRPYAWPEKEWLRSFVATLVTKTATARTGATPAA